MPVHVDPIMEHLEEIPSRPSPDPRPPRPLPSVLPMKMKPFVPGHHSRPGPPIRALHDDHQDDHHHYGGIKPPPSPRMRRPPSPLGDDVVRGPKTPPLPMKPSPGVVGAAPKPKPKPKAKPKPSALSVERDIDMMTSEAQNQCQMDYSRFCASSLSSGFGTSFPSSLSGNPIFFDVIMSDVMDVPKPCGAKINNAVDDFVEDNDEDIDDDDDENDDDSSSSSSSSMDFEIAFDSPLLSVVRDMFSALRLSRPVPVGVTEGPPMQESLIPVTRMLWMQGPIAEEYVNENPIFLGFGLDGDMCLLDHYDVLSSSCRESIDDLQVVIDDIDMDDEVGCPVIPLILLFLLLAVFVRFLFRRRMIQRQDTLHKTLSAIHASPELKAKVEAASGVPVPPTLPACRARLAMAQQPWYVKLLCFVGVVVISFLLVINAMLITGLIVGSIYDGNDDAGDGEEPSPLLILAILFLVLTLEILIVKRIRAAVCSYLNSSPTPTTASTGTSSSGDDNNTANVRSTLPQIFHRMRSVQISSLLPSSFSRPQSFSSAANGEQYEPLLSEDEREQDNTSVMMVQVPASAPPASMNSSGITNIPVVLAPYGTPSNVQGSIAMF